MMLLRCNSDTRNGRGKVITTNMQYLREALQNFLLCCFLKVCKSSEIISIGFNIRKAPCLGKPSKNLLFGGKRELACAQLKLTELTIIEFVQKLFDLEIKLISKFRLYTVEEEWLLKTRNHLEI